MTGLRFELGDSFRSDGEGTQDVIARTSDGVPIAEIVLTRRDASGPGWLTAEIRFGVNKNDELAAHGLATYKWRAVVDIQRRSNALAIGEITFGALGGDAVTTDTWRQFKVEWLWGAATCVSDVEQSDDPLDAASFINREVHPVRPPARGRPRRSNAEDWTLAKTLLDPPPGDGSLYRRVGSALRLSPESVRKYKRRLVDDGFLDETVTTKGPVLRPGPVLRAEGVDE